jgi:Zn-dependent protease with chaperone function
MAVDVRDLMPAWVAWLGPVAFVAAATWGFLLVAVVATRRILREYDPHAHWTDQARIAHAVRVTYVLTSVILPPVVLAFSRMMIGPMSPTPWWALGVPAAVLVFLMSMRLEYGFERDVLGQPVGGAARHMAVGMIRLAAYAGIALLLVLAPGRLSSPMMPVWLACAVLVGLALRYQLVILRGLTLAQPADEGLRAIVRRVGAEAGYDVDRVVVIDSHMPNAFAMSWLRTVGFTSRALEVLEPEQVGAVAAHEIAHLQERRSVTVLRQLMHFVWIPLAAARPILATWGAAGLAAVVLVVLAVAVANARMRSRMERLADVVARDHTHGSEAFGSALASIYRTGLVPAVLRRDPHGHLHERLVAAGVEPDFDPPPAPSLRQPAVLAVAAFLIPVLVLFSPWLVVRTGSRQTTAHVAASLNVYGGWPYEELALQAEVAGDLLRAGVLYERAADVSSGSSQLVDAAVAYARAGRCEDARRVAARLLSITPPAAHVWTAEEWVAWCDASFSA